MIFLRQRLQQYISSTTSQPLDHLLEQIRKMLPILQTEASHTLHRDISLCLLILQTRLLSQIQAARVVLLAPMVCKYTQRQRLPRGVFPSLNAYLQYEEDMNSE